MIDGLYAIDYQVHSFRSHDGRATIMDQCARAVQIGLDEIGFSEHKDFDPEDPVVDYFDYDLYMREIEAARDRFAGSLQIRAGVEIDYQHGFEEAIDRFLRANPFDFVIGSVHYVGGRMIMSPEYNALRTARTAYGDYFAAVQDSVECRLFDILGHLEYANRRGIASWGPYDASSYTEPLGRLFETMIANGVAFEINTAGLHQSIGVTYPTETTLRQYVSQGGSLISIGSDAHHPDQLGHAYPIAASMAKRAGIQQVCTWRGRRMSLAQIGPQA